MDAGGNGTLPSGHTGHLSTKARFGVRKYALHFPNGRRAHPGMSIRTLIETVDRKAGSPLARTARRTRHASGVAAIEEGLRWVDFEVDRRRRLRRYANSYSAEIVDAEALASLRADGVTVLRGAADRTMVSALRSELEIELDSGAHLTQVANDAVRSPGDRSEAREFLLPADLEQGQAAFRDRTNFGAVADLFVRCPMAIRFALDQRYLALAGAYLGCPPAIGGGNLRKSFLNDLPDFDTLFFHSDRNSPRFLKFFFYLHDVDEGHGPFAYVRGSHRQKFKGWRSKYRWSHDEIAAVYGADSILLMTAQMGDVVVADTTGFHRGTKVTSGDRSMLTVDYVVHQEFAGRSPAPRAAPGDLKNMSEPQVRALDFLDICSADER